MELNFTLIDWGVFGGIFLTSVGYAILLQKWQRYFPDSFDDLTWLQVVVGVGYVLLWLRLIIPLQYWLIICTAFFFACLAIVFRSIWNTAHQKREVKENGG